MPRIRNRPQSIYVMELVPSGEVKIGIAENAVARWRWLRMTFPRGGLRLVFVSEPSPQM